MTKKRRFQPKPKDGTQEQEAQEPEANNFGPSEKPQEEYIDDGIWSVDRHAGHHTPKAIPPTAEEILKYLKSH